VQLHRYDTAIAKGNGIKAFVPVAPREITGKAAAE
jgi:hypothetical protein